MADVKQASKRTLKARETRRRILAAAKELFVEQGYGVTTLAEVAERAGVAIQTIYFVFGNKRMLLKEVADVVVAGDDEPVATMDRPWFTNALEADTAEASLRVYVAGVGDVLERVAEITKVVVTASAMDPEVADLWSDNVDPRFVVQKTAATALAAKPGVRPGLSADEAADLLYCLLSPELYLLFTRERGWPQQRWQQWAFDTLRSQLCEP